VRAQGTMFLGFFATWSPRPFDEFGGFDPNPPQSIRQPLGLSTAQWLGTAGGLLLGVGTFLPAFGSPLRSSLLLEVDLTVDGLPIDGLVVLVLAVASVVLAARNFCVLLWLTAIFAQMAMASSYALWEPSAPVYVPKPNLGLFFPDSGLRVGWWVMELGLFLLLIAAFLGELPPLRHWKPMPPTADSGQFPSSSASTPT
jgi:hypothetical protein